jgi:hypothetical protein
VVFVNACSIETVNKPECVATSILSIKMHGNSGYHIGGFCNKRPIAVIRVSLNEDMLS